MGTLFSDMSKFRLELDDYMSIFEEEKKPPTSGGAWRGSFPFRGSMEGVF